MSEQARPWWASDGPVDGGIDPDEDPVERVRAARRGASDAPATGDGEPWLEAVAQTLSRLVEASGHAPGPDAAGGPAPGAAEAPPADGRPPSGDGEAAAHTADVCGVCPICVGLRTLAESRPELVGHLAEAARHVALAARSLQERAEAPSPRASRDGQPLEHIDLE